MVSAVCYLLLESPQSVVFGPRHKYLARFLERFADCHLGSGVEQLGDEGAVEDFATVLD